MKLSIAEIAVIMDTLSGSLAIADGGRIFGYTHETRKLILEHITEQTSHEFVYVNSKKSDEGMKQYGI